MQKSIRVIAAVAFSSIAFSGCGEKNTDKMPLNSSREVTSGGNSSEGHGKSAKTALLLWDFENGKQPKELKLQNATAEVIQRGSGKALSIRLLSEDNHTSAFSFEPEGTWDWSAMGNFAFALDISNAESSSVHLYVKATDNEGRTHSRSFVVPEQSSATYFFEMKGPDLAVDTGIRSNPPSWMSEYQDMIYRWGDKSLNVSEIDSIEFSVAGVLENKYVVVDNVRLIQPESLDEMYLVNLVDEFGQNNKRDFTNKVHSLEELREASERELAQLRKTPLEGRSRFGGWALGPRLKGSGYFRTEKVDGKWSLVDPDGYLFFSTGIANVRLANTSTITGYDFDHALIPARKPGDLTPEDSLGLNRVPDVAVPTRYVSSSLRADMFTWLPAYDEPLGKNFGYRREVHTGAIERGETFSFYRANLQRKYGIDDDKKLMEKWREVTVDRMLSWGFTSFGNWIDPGYYQMDRFPYFANGWIIGNFKTVSSGNDYWSPLPDPFDPLFKERAYITAEQIAKEVKGSPWCVGVFVDNEKSWGQEGSVETQYGLVINTLTRDAKESPTKAQFVRLMREKYGDIQKLNKSWGVSIDSWNDFASGISLNIINDSVIKDLSTMLQHYSDQYFRIVREAVKHYMPNHMYMGARFADWGMTPEIRAAAANYADVVSYNYYKEGVSDNFWHFLKELDRPSIIGEFHNGALDSGLLNPGLIHASSQADRGKKYAEYMNSVIDNPYLVGAHWFQYIDSPLTGRAYDGENYNVGFVSVTDIPYSPLVESAKAVNKNLYQRRFGSM
ncbi:beta-galactosidase [Microbulbifer thermotolerans]|uniref:beta-galactosidase n=1 Tax=Microbulbifer thermotolerans TaxID=252514 RepID=UPI0022499707|nr:beta-galactosidase [Microbulbifer thermotolerans]MCX2831022.1 beta-galactosidase [Microbulbifer thermotolerans]